MLPLRQTMLHTLRALPLRSLLRAVMLPALSRAIRLAVGLLVAVFPLAVPLLTFPCYETDREREMWSYP